MQKKQAVVHWSGGKDCAYAFYLLQKKYKIKVDRLFVTLNEENKISMHGIDKSLIELQAVSLGVPVEFVMLPSHASNQEYEATLLAAIQVHKNDGIHYAVFGDIFLSDVRKYRESLFQAAELKALFPLWNFNTHTYAMNFIKAGFKAKIASVNTSTLNASFAGRDYDYSFIEDLPDNVDPCGENGEFHTFVYDGPIFSRELSIKTGFVKSELFPSHEQTLEDTRICSAELTIASRDAI